MATAAPPRPQRRRTFGIDLDTDLDHFAPGSPSPPVSPSPSTPSDASCGGQVEVRARSAGSDHPNPLAQQQATRTYQKPRGSRPLVSEVKVSYTSVVSPTVGPVKPPPMSPLPPLPGSTTANGTPQPKRPPKKLVIPTMSTELPAVERPSSPESDASPISASSPEEVLVAQGIRRAQRVQLHKRKASLKFRMQKIRPHGEEKEKLARSSNTAFDRRPSVPLLTPHSDYRLSLPASPDGSPTSDDRGHFQLPSTAESTESTESTDTTERTSPASTTTAGLSSATTATTEGFHSRPVVGFDPLPIFINDTEMLAEEHNDMSGMGMVSTQARTHTPWASLGRSWDDAAYFISPLERIQAVQLDANGPASLPTTPDFNHVSFSPDTPRGLTPTHERKNLAALLREAGPTLATATHTPTEDERIDQHQGQNRFSVISVRSPQEGASPSAESFSHQSFGCHLDDAERMTMVCTPIDERRQSHIPMVSSPLATTGVTVGRSATTTRLGRTGGANHPFLVDGPMRPKSQAVLHSTMKSLPTTPVEVISPGPLSPGSTQRRNTARNSFTPSAAASDGAQSQRLRFSRSLASVFRKAQADHDRFSFSGDVIPNMTPPVRSNTISSTASKKAQRSRLQDPPEPFEDALFDVSRKTSRRRMFEAAKCRVLDEDGNPVRVGDLFPRWPERPGSNYSNTPFRRDSSWTATSAAPTAAETDGPPPRTILFFLRNFWCGMCQDYTLMSISQLDPAVLAANNIRVVIIGCGNYKMIKPYKKLFKLQFECYTDGPRQLYELMGMTKEAAFVQPVRNRAAYNRPYVKQVFAGVKNGIGHLGGPLADPGYWRQLGGEFIIAPGYKCEFAHRMTNMANHMEALDVLVQAGVDVSGHVPLRDDSAALEALDLAGNSMCRMPELSWMDNEEVMDEPAEMFKPPVKHYLRSTSSSSQTGTSLEEITDGDEPLISPPPDLVPPGSESSSEEPLGDSLMGTPDDLDPIEMHRRIYSNFVLQGRADSPKPLSLRTSGGSLVTVDAEGKPVSGRKMVMIPAA